MLSVPAYKLEDWSNRTTASSEFPRWIARLIWASCADLRRLDMPGGEHVHLAGFDGIVECDIGNDMTPAGISAWELSVRKDVCAKANEDFNGRNNNPGHLDKQDVAFVFATPRKWGDSRDWEDEKAGAGWREVRTIWSSHLERWFERVPWLAAEFLDSLGECPPGLESLGMVWASYEHVAGAGKLSADFVMGGRTDVANSFLRWLNASPFEVASRIRVAGSSHREVLHYLAASICNGSERDRSPWDARLFHVNTEEAARGLRGLNGSHVILVPGGPAMAYVLRAQERSGCRVVIMDTTPQNAVAQPAPGIESIRLSPVGEETWVRSLRKASFSSRDAISLCREHGCDYDRLRRAAFLY